MRRIAFLLPVVWVCLGSGLIASSGTEYKSPHTKLSYRHTKLAIAGGGEVREYVVPAPSGELMLTITNAEGRYRIVTESVATGSDSTLSYSPPSEFLPAELALAWPQDRLSARFSDHGEPGQLEQIAGTVPNCDKLREGELPRLRNEVFGLVRADYVAWPAPPLHLQALMAALYFSQNAPLIAAGCGAPIQLAAGRCYSGHQGFGDCQQCCEDVSGIEGLICSAAVYAACAGSNCIRLRGLICAGMMNLSANYCVVHNCRGKPGDPHCDQNSPCEGQCMYFCGPGWSSACGNCDGQVPFHGQCCR